MIILAAALTLGIEFEIDLTSLINRHKERTTGTVTCGIKVVGYHFKGQPGQQFRYAGETYTIPREGYVEVISLPKVKTYVAEGRTLPLDETAGDLDGFSFRWIDLAGASTGTSTGTSPNEGTGK